MTPKEQVEDLWLTYYESLPDGVYSNKAAKADAKQFALIAVEKIREILCHELGHDATAQGLITYYEDVKKEILKL